MNTTHEIREITTLPSPLEEMTWRNLNVFRSDQRGPDFYLECLRYAQYLWVRGLSARAILCLDRAMGADLRGNEVCLDQYPLPYGAIVHIIRETPEDVFIGNPRVHFQHYADRLGAPRQEIRKWRAWACWALTRSLNPNLPGDPKHHVVEPNFATIESKLEIHGHPGEAKLWKAAF